MFLDSQLRQLFLPRHLDLLVHLFLDFLHHRRFQHCLDSLLHQLFLLLLLDQLDH